MVYVYNVFINGYVRVGNIGCVCEVFEFMGDSIIGVVVFNNYFVFFILFGYVKLLI